MSSFDPIAIARDRGFRLGRKNQHTTGDIFATSAEWAAWLAGHREGFALYLQEQSAILTGTFGAAVTSLVKIPAATERRAAYLERKSA